MKLMWSYDTGDELYVYWRGVLIYKKWFNTSTVYGREYGSYSVVMDSIGLPWFTDHRDRQ